MKHNTPKLVFVSGASRGIGKGIADWFLKRGYFVAYGYFKNRHFEESLKKNKHFLSVQVDIKKRSSVKKAIDRAQAYFQKNIDIAVNNAAISQEKTFATISDQDWDLMLETNLKGPFIVSQEVLPLMIKSNWGRIINVASIGGQWGGINQIHYAASKAGLINLTMSIAKTYSSFGITCNAVSPGLVNTDMASREINSQEGKKKIDNIPIGRIASTLEIASAVGFLASNEAAYITGQTVNINGGMYFG